MHRDARLLLPYRSPAAPVGANVVCGPRDRPVSRRRWGWLLLALGAVLLAAAWWARLAGALTPGALRGLISAGVSFAVVGLLFWGSADACDSGTPALRRRYRREFVPAMLAYVAVLYGSMWLLKRVAEPEWLRALIALAPVLPIALSVRAIVRYIRDIDELQQRIELEAVSIATALVALGYLAGGFLQLAKVIDVAAGAAMIWVFPLVCLTYGVAKIVVSRRYA